MAAWLLLVAAAPVHAIVQLGVQGNYVSDKFSSGSRESGFGFGGYGRFTLGIPLLLTFGAGLYADFATLKSDVAGQNDSRQLRAGGELAVYLDVIGNVIGFIPHARFGFGYVGNTRTVTVSSGAGQVAGDVVYYGTGGHSIFGLTKQIVPLVYLFAEGGLQWSSLTPAIPTALKNAGLTLSDITTSGWRASLGAMLWI
ncbi:MAG: hypothetical protein NZL89_05140 [Leptospiraceae bacterium]|nr:hypothetical protein [Leptospiraceae bacterium]